MFGNLLPWARYIVACWSRKNTPQGLISRCGAFRGVPYSGTDLNREQTSQQTNQESVLNMMLTSAKEGTQSKKDVGFDKVHAYILLTLHTYIIHTSSNSVGLMNLILQG